MKIFSLVSAFYFFFFAIIGVYVIYLPKVLELVGYSPVEIGAVFALSPLMRFITPFFFLKKASLNRKIFKLSLLLLVSAAVLAFFTLESFYLFIIPNILLGISFAISLPYVETIALKYIGKERYGKSRLFGSLGFILIALVLAKFMNDPKYALWFLFLAVIFTALFGYLLSDIEAQKNGEILEFNLWKFWFLWVNLFLMQVSFGPFYNFFTIYETQHGLDYETISYLWTFGVVAEIVMLYFQGPLLRKNLFFILKLCTFLTSLRWLMLHLYPDNIFLLYISQSLHAFSFALYYSAAITLLFKLYENKTLAQQFFGGISFGLGGMAGSFLAGLFYGEFIFLYASFVAFLAFLILFKR